VYRQRFAVGRYDTMDVANHLAILLEIKIPSVCINLLPERRIGARKRQPDRAADRPAPARPDRAAC
jgi:hypothetical protein